MGSIPFYLHDLGQRELDSIAEVFNGPILTTGETVERFENRFREYLHVRHALAVTSCTGALHLALIALGIGRGDEVITTPMTFVATALAVIAAGATPVFVDVEPETGNLNPELIEPAITERTKAILPVHLYGLMCDMKRIRAIADKHGLRIIEDAAHCIEGHRNGIRPGQLSDAAAFSFYATKNLTCGEGGAIITNNSGLDEKLRLLRLHGMTKTAWDRYREGYTHWDVIVPGWKYNMSNIDAAILLPQLDRIHENLVKRQTRALRYVDALAGINSVRLQASVDDCTHAHHIFPIWIEGADRDQVMINLQKRGISTMVNYRAIHLHSHFRKAYGHVKGQFPIAERMGETTLSLPFYPNIPDEHVDAVAKALREILS